MLHSVAHGVAIWYRWAMDRNDVMAGAKKIAASLEGPFGRRKLQPVIAEHLDYFQKARASGALWPQIADALARAGIRSPEGAPYRANILRAMVSRAERSSHPDLTVCDLVAAPTPPAVKPSQEYTKARLPRQRPASTNLSSSPANASNLDAVRERIARASRLRGLDGKDG